MRRFSGSPDAVGRRLKINGSDWTVIGVMGPAFTFPLRRQAARTPYPYVDFWAPLQMDDGGALGMVARLREGVSPEQAQAELATVSAALRREFPVTNRDRTHRLAPLRDRTIGRAGAALWLSLGAAVLLIGCANVAHLLLARSVARQHEMAVRRALGASSARLVRQLLTESCVLALIGGICGYLLTSLAWRMLPALVPLPSSIPRLAAARVDWTILAFAMAVAVGNGILFGIAPAWQAAAASRLRVRGGDGADRHGNSVRQSLLIGEVAVTVMLVVMGWQLVGGLVRLLQTDPGFDAERVLASVVLPARERYRTTQQRALVYQKFLDAVRRLPGVSSAGTVNALPFSGENHGGFIAANEEQVLRPGAGNIAEVDVVGGDYLEALGVRLVAGRWFHEEEMRESDVAIVDETVAERMWGTDAPAAIGRRLCVHCTPEEPNRWKRVVGVVSDTRHRSLEEPVGGNVYLAGGAMEAAAFLVVRTERPFGEMEKAIRLAIAEVDPDQPVLLSASMRNLVDDSIADRRFVVSLLGITAMLALAMSAAGIYGVTAYTTSRRTREFGIRMAVGATHRDVLALVMRQGFTSVWIGLGVGLLLATWGSVLLRKWGVGVVQDGSSPWMAAAVVVASAGAACWIAARRATHGDPLAALRQD
jgi:putative ABC transport system permease protein